MVSEQKGTPEEMKRKLRGSKLFMSVQCAASSQSLARYRSAKKEFKTRWFFVAQNTALILFEPWILAKFQRETSFYLSLS